MTYDELMTPVNRNIDGTYTAPCPNCKAPMIHLSASGILLKQGCLCHKLVAGNTTPPTGPVPKVQGPPKIQPPQKVDRETSEQDEFKLLSPVGEYLRNIGEPPPMLIEGLLPQYKLVLLTGAPKHGKSYVALEIADAIATGRNVFGTFSVNTPGPVVLLDMENGSFEIARRLIQMGMHPDDPRPIHICDERLVIGDPSSVEKLRRLVEPIQPVLLIIDTAREALGVRNWNDASEVSDSIRGLRTFSHEVCTVLLLHHNRKGGGISGEEISGSNAVTGAADGWMSCSKKEPLQNGNLRMYYTIDGRCGMKGNIVLEMNTSTLQINSVDTPNEEGNGQKINTEWERIEKATAVFANAPRQRLTVAEYANKIGVHPKTAEREIKGLVKEQIIFDTGSKGGKSNNAVVYALRDDHTEQSEMDL